MYEEVLDAYKIPSINVREKIKLGILTNAYKSTDILYDGVHTTNQGAIIYVDAINNALILMLNVKIDEVSKMTFSFDSAFRYT